MVTLDNIKITYYDLKKLFRKNFIEVTEQVLFEACKISEDLLDPKGNNYGPGYENYNFIRGGEHYYPPYSWHAYGLKVLNKYDNRNNDWLSCNNNPNEWAVAYHGVGGQRGKCNNIFANVNSIAQTNLNPGERQLYKDYENIWYLIKNRYHKCGVGVYLTPIVEAAQKFADVDEFKGKNFQLIMMCRVNPKKIRQPDIRYTGAPYWILNGNSQNIRPYRILIKEY